MILIPQSVVYRGTITGLRISSVDGTAFLDACAALVPYADGNHTVEIYPSGGGALGLKGFLKAQGAGEGLGAAQNVSNFANAGTVPFDVFSDASATGFHAENTAGTSEHAYSADEIVFVAGGLLKRVCTLTLTSGAAPNIRDTQNNYLTVALGAPGVTLSAGANSLYSTLKSSTIGCLRVGSLGASSFTLSDIAITSVTAPSTDGVTIVSTKGGTNYNFAYKNAGFVYNAASYYVIVRKVR
jgi:hypothetical protein